MTAKKELHPVWGFRRNNDVWFVDLTVIDAFKTVLSMSYQFTAHDLTGNNAYVAITEQFKKLREKVPANYSTSDSRWTAGQILCFWELAYRRGQPLDGAGITDSKDVHESAKKLLEIVRREVHDAQSKIDQTRDLLAKAPPSLALQFNLLVEQHAELQAKYDAVCLRLAELEHEAAA